MKVEADRLKKMLGLASVLFADQLRMLDVKDATTPSKYAASSARYRSRSTLPL